MEKITAYKCNFCSKIYQREKNCRHHELYCTNNHKNHFLCLKCNNLKVSRNMQTGIKEFRCVPLNIQLHSHVALRRNLKCVNNTEKMKLECNMFKFLNDSYEF